MYILSKTPSLTRADMPLNSMDFKILSNLRYQDCIACAFHGTQLSVISIFRSHDKCSLVITDIKILGSLIDKFSDSNIGWKFVGLERSYFIQLEFSLVTLTNTISRNAEVWSNKKVLLPSFYCFLSNTFFKSAPDLKWACFTHMCPVHILTQSPLVISFPERSPPCQEACEEKKFESCPVHTVRNHIPVCTCINRSLIVFRFFLFLQLLKHGFCCLHIFKKPSFILHKQYGFLYLL